MPVPSGRILYEFGKITPYNMLLGLRRQCFVIQLFKLTEGVDLCYSAAKYELLQPAAASGRRSASARLSAGRVP